MSACCLAPNLQGSSFDAMASYSRDIGLAFQIRDDILDVEGETDVIGKPSGSDEALNKATWPALFGMDESKRRCRELYKSANDSLDAFGEASDSLRFLATLIVDRTQ